MNRVFLFGFALALSGCGVSHAEYDAKVQEAATAKQQVDTAKRQIAQLQSQVTASDQQVTDLKNSLGMAQSQAITDEQKTELEDAKRAVEDAQERGKMLTDLQAKFKSLIDAGHLKVTTRRGRVALQLHNDVLFNTGEAILKPDGKKAVSEVAATLRGIGGKRFQVAGHTDNAPITAATKKKYPSNWELSADRAIAVVKLLVADGVDPSMLSAAGYGPYDSVAPNGSPDGQAKNRRIEITLVPHVAPLTVAADMEAKK